MVTDPKPIDREGIKIISMGLTEAVQDFPPLPYIATELDAIQDLLGGTHLQDQAFVIPSVEKEMKGEEFTIVHIASHGKFESDVKKTFLLTYEGQLTMDRLDQLIGLFQFRDTPLDLLVLSACQTAAGDDRAALGLAGVAITAGARSALATLWFINNQVTSELVAEFYRQLKNPKLSKAASLQMAQRKILGIPAYEHPSFWTPFLLINNWL